MSKESKISYAGGDDEGIKTYAGVFSMKDRQIVKWQRVAYLAIASTLVSVLCVTYIGTKSTFIPYVIHVDEKTGYVQSLGALTEKNAKITDAEVNYFLSRFVEGMRNIPTDSAVLQTNVNRAVKFLTPEAANKYKNLYLNSFTGEIGTVVSRVTVLSCLPVAGQKNKTREVHLGETLSEFLTRIGLGRTGGKNGTITRLRKQLNSLFTCFISCTSNWKHKGGGNIKSIANMLIADEADLWWDPHTLYDESGEFCSYVILSESFYNAINKAPIPVDFNAVLKLKQSPMAVDIYCWATYRMCYCHSRTFIPWEDLALQFGSIESNLRKFKFRFKKHLVSVQKIYPDFKCDTSDPKGLVIFPSKTSIKKTK